MSSHSVPPCPRTRQEAAPLRAVRDVTSRTLLLTILLASVAGPAFGFGRTFHVDIASPWASPDGPGTLSRPYDNISNALAAHHDSADMIVVHPGIYRDRVSVPASGSAGRPLVVRASGAGVVIDGADDLGSTSLWQPYVGDVWLAATVDWQPMQVFMDGSRLTPSALPPADLPVGAFCYAPGGGLFVNIGGENPGFHDVAVGRRSVGFLVSGKANIVIDGFEIVRAEDKGIDIHDSDRITVRHNIVTGAYGGGISAESSTHVQVHANRVSDNNHHGILFRLGVTNSIIDSNESFLNAHAGESWATGIYLAGSPGNLIENNRVHDNQDSGIEVQTGSNDCIVRQNMSWANGDHGFAQLYATGTVLVGDVAYGNRHEAFSVEGQATNTRLYNCIAVNPGVSAGTYCVLVDTSSTVGFDADFNILWNSVGAPPIKFGRDIYASVNAFRTATGIGPATFATDPRFADPDNGDFHLLPESPAIDAGTSAVPGWVEDDAEGRMRSDSPGVPNAGTGPVGFADRGALEFQGGVLAVGGRSSSSGLSLSSAYPNPSRRSVAFTLESSAPSEARWAVFDVLGREVWSNSEKLTGGRQELRWPLTDRSGSRVPNGIYMVRVERAGEAATMRFVVMH